MKNSLPSVHSIDLEQAHTRSLMVRAVQDVASRTHSAEEDGSCVVCLSNPCSAGFVHGDRCLALPASQQVNKQLHMQSQRCIR